MKFTLGGLFLIAGLALQSTSAVATVPVSCAPGLAPVQSEGIQISGGVIELLDDACRPTQGGVLPPALAFSNITVTPAVINAGQSTTYTATVSGLIGSPVAGVTYDQCSLDVVRPNGQVESTIPVTALSANLSVTVSIPTGVPAGNWQLNMRCKRFVSGQEIVVPAIASAALQVNSTAVPGSCSNLTAPFVAGISGAYISHFQTAFGDQHTWVWDVTGNVFLYNAQSTSYDLQGVRVRSYSFVAPAAGQQAKISFPSSTAGITASISSACGDFSVPQHCIGVASSAIQWSTASSPPSFRCPLTPGQTYYLNYAWFDYPTYLSTGNVNSTCSCPGPQCTGSGQQFASSCQYGNNSTP